jgi:hypothetical protein
MSKYSRTKFLAALAILIVSSIPAGYASAADAATENSPVLVELFTSEGCSSCPPADAWLQQMDSSQPVSGVHLIVLSEHVDYWDHDGWKDRYSSHFFTDRQNDYVRALALKSAYTPMVLVDGTTEVHVNDEAQVTRGFQSVVAARKVPIRVSSIEFEGTNPATMRAHVEADGRSAEHKGDIFVALALDHAESQVAHGENGGRHLTHVSVAQELTKIGRLEKGKLFSQDVRLQLKAGMDASNTRVIVFVQESGPGKVLGAAVGKTEK